jgi:hypothetical protein
MIWYVWLAQRCRRRLLMKEDSIRIALSNLCLLCVCDWVFTAMRKFMCYLKSLVGTLPITLQYVSTEDFLDEHFRETLLTRYIGDFLASSSETAANKQKVCDR